MKIKFVFYCSLVLAGVLSLHGATFLNNCKTSGTPIVGYGAPYGYKSSSQGPGAEAFDNILRMCNSPVEYKYNALWDGRLRPVVIIYGKDNCQVCSQFAQMVNDDPRGLPPFFGYGRSVTGYFRGNDSGTAPSACVAARKFFDSHLGGAKGSCHLIGCYGLYEDGTVGIKTSQVLAGDLLTADGYAAWVKNQIVVFDRNYDKHLYKPPAANAAFAVETNRLQAVEGTRQVYVPFVRTNDVDHAEVNDVVATFPSGVVTTNSLAWTAGMTNREVAVSLPGGVTWGDVGDTTHLELLSTNGVSVATNDITRVAAENSLRFPSLGKPSWGSWTLLEGAAVDPLPDCVKTANEHDVTNAVPTTADRGIARVETGTANVDVPHTRTTNITAMVVAPVTNFICCVVTNYAVANVRADEEHAAGSSVTNVSAGVVSTNALQGLFLFDGIDAAVVEASTHSLATQVVKQTERRYTFAAFREPQLQPWGDVTPVGTVAFDSTNEIYNVTGRYVQTNDFTITTNYQATVTNYVAEVSDPATNWIDRVASTNAQSYTAFTRATNQVLFATNFVTRHTVSTTLSNLVYDVTREQYAPANARAFQLRVTGGLVWCARIQELAEAFSKPAFKNWCAANQVVCTVVDQRHPASNASLFTHARAENGERGTSFLSRNGLPESPDRSPVGTTFKVELIRPQGVCVDGVPDCADGVQKAEGQVVGDVSVADGETIEQILAKLDALVALGKEDPTESANNAVETTPLELAFGTTNATQSLSVVDRVDVFRLTGDFANKATTFTCCTNDVSAAGFFALVVSDGAGNALPPLAGTDGEAESAGSFGGQTMGVWSFTEEQKANGVYVTVTFADGQTPSDANAVAYALGAVEAPANPGTVSFVPMGDDIADPADATRVLTNALHVTEGSTDDVGAFTFVRTEGCTNYFAFAVERTGYTGAAKCRVSLDVDAIPESERGRCAWGGTKILAWADLESGVKTVEIGLVDDGIWCGWTKLAFKLEREGEDGPHLGDETAFTLVYDDDEQAAIGKLSIVGMDVVNDDETRSPISCANKRYYVKQGEHVAIRVERVGGNSSNVVGRLTGTGVAFVTPSTGEYTWQEKAAKDALTKEFILKPTVDIGKNGYTDVTVTLAGDGIVVDASPVKFRVLSDDAPSFVDPDGVTPAGLTNEWSGTQYVAFDKSVTLAADGITLVPGSLEKIAGSVPPGLKASLDTTTGRIVVSGVPTAAAAATLVYQAKVRQTAGTDAIYTMPVTLYIVVSALSEVNETLATARSWTDIPMLVDWNALEGEQQAARRRLFGLLNLSVKPNGRTSAKVRMDTGKTVSFSAGGFAGLDEASGVVTLGAERRVGGIDYALRADVHPDGKVDAEVCTNGVVMASGTVTGPKVFDRTNPATDFAGTYAVAFTNEASTGSEPLCTGDATMNLKMTASGARTGRMTYAGVLPNGRSFSGTATLVPADAKAETTAELPILAAAASDAFTACLAVTKDGAVTAAEGVEAFAAHRENKFAVLSYETWMDCVGQRWVVGAADDVELPGGVSRNKSTGRLVGTVRESNPETGRRTTKTVRGIVVPGCATPFGAMWWNETWQVERDDGRTVRKTVRVGEGFPAQ